VRVIKDLGGRPAPVSVRDFLSRIVRGHGPAIKVERRQIPYWQERGWVRQGETYQGSYQTKYIALWGQIWEHRGGRRDFLLYAPTEPIRHHGHWVCFQHRGNDWYLVHMGRPPRDVSSGILTIERLITEAYEA
jgi:hypothetical protein